MYTDRPQLNVRVTHRTRSQWSETLRLAKLKHPGLTGAALIRMALRRIRTGLVRELDPGAVAGALANEKKPARTSKGPPPPRPPNVH